MYPRIINNARIDHKTLKLLDSIDVARFLHSIIELFLKIK